jgi:hypothetical protein
MDSLAHLSPWSVCLTGAPLWYQDLSLRTGAAVVAALGALPRPVMVSCASAARASAAAMIYQASKAGWWPEEASDQ